MLVLLFYEVTLCICNRTQFYSRSVVVIVHVTIVLLYLAALATKSINTYLLT